MAMKSDKTAAANMATTISPSNSTACRGVAPTRIIVQATKHPKGTTHMAMRLSRGAMARSKARRWKWAVASAWVAPLPIM